MPRTIPADSDDSGPRFSFPAIGRKKVTSAFDGGRLTSDGGVLLLAQAQREMQICARSCPAGWCRKVSLRARSEIKLGGIRRLA